MKKRKSIKKVSLIIGIVLIVCVVIFFTGRSFSFFRYVKEGNVTNIITIKGIEVEVLNPENDSLNLENVYPVSDSEGLTYTPFKFTVTNTSKRSLNYSIMVVNDIEKQADCKLEDGKMCPELSTDYIKYSYRKNDGTYTEPRNLGDNGDIIDNGVIEGNETVKSSIIIWIDEKAGNEIMNHYFYGKVIIVGSANTSENYEETLLNGADPVLSDNLVPVKIDNNGTVTKANIKEEWYSYNRKEWANAVVLKDRYDTNTIYDLSGNNFDAELVNGLNIVEDSDGSYALNFDGVDDYALLPTLPSSINWQDGYTIEFEATWDATNIYSRIFDFGNGRGDNIVVFNYYDTNNLIHNYYTDTMTQNKTTVENVIELSKKSKYKITVSKISGGYVVNIYQNDKIIGNNTFSTGYIENKDRVNNYLGKSNYYDNGDEYFKGKIYNLKITQADGNVILWYDFNQYENDDVIPEEAIESYFVWIPKYSYELWDLGNYSSLTTIDTTKPHTIPIKFGLTNTSDSNTGECTTPGLAGKTGNCKVGDYMTHPAFLAFNTNGLWVGKFETGYDGATSTSDAQTNTNIVDTNKIVIKSNKYSWRNINIVNAFKNSYDYLRNSESHMMKNTEWGAIAYLQHSNYGSQKSVRLNNNSSFITGYAATKEPTLGMNNGTSIAENRIESTIIGIDGENTINYFNKNSVVSSTTGNYTGIYDMSGGASDYMMGYTTADNVNASGITNIYSDFFTNNNWDKYYDKYNAYQNINYNNRILGDATGEMGPFGTKEQPSGESRAISSWYDDSTIFIDDGGPWFGRGGTNTLGSMAGIFAYTRIFGGSNVNSSFRIVLAPTK